MSYVRNDKLNSYLIEVHDRLVRKYQEGNVSEKTKALISDIDQLVACTNNFVVDKNSDEILQRLSYNKNVERQAGLLPVMQDLTVDQLGRLDPNVVAFLGRDLFMLLLQDNKFRTTFRNILEVFLTTVAHGRVMQQRDAQYFSNKLCYHLSLVAENPEYIKAFSNLFVIQDYTTRRFQQSQGQVNRLGTYEDSIDALWRDNKDLIERFSGRGSMEKLKTAL